MRVAKSSANQTTLKFAFEINELLWSELKIKIIYQHYGEESLALADKWERGATLQTKGEPAVINWLATGAVLAEPFRRDALEALAINRLCMFAAERLARSALGGALANPIVDTVSVAI